MDSCRTADQPQVGPFRRDAAGLQSRSIAGTDRRAVRLGLTSVNGIGRTLAEKIVAERDRQPYADMNDVVRRAGLTVAQTEALATAGAFDRFGLSRRQALWNAGYADSADTLPGTAVDAAPPELPGMSDGRADPGRPVGDQDLARGAPDLPPAVGAGGAGDPAGRVAGAE